MSWGAHFRRISGIEGLWVGPAGREILVVNEDGQVVAPSAITNVRAEYFQVPYNAALLDTGVTVGLVNVNNILLAVHARVVTAWDSSTALLNLGTASSPDLFVDDGDLTSTGLLTIVAGSLPMSPPGAVTALKAKVATTGGDPTEGLAEIILVKAIL